MSHLENREVYFEFVQSGPFVKVAAVDAATGVEAVIQGPASASPLVLKQNALNKLAYLLKKKGLIEGT